MPTHTYSCRQIVGGVVELTALNGYYAMIAMTLNEHRIPLPDGDPVLEAQYRRQMSRDVAYLVAHIDSPYTAAAPPRR